MWKTEELSLERSFFMMRVAMTSCTTGIYAGSWGGLGWNTSAVLGLLTYDLWW